MTRDEISELLEKYGRHLPGCSWKNGVVIGQDKRKCDCGFDQVLTGLKEQPCKTCPICKEEPLDSEFPTTCQACGRKVCCSCVDDALVCKECREGEYDPDCKKKGGKDI